MDELKQILQRVRMALGEDDYRVMNAVVETLSYLTHLAKDKQAAEIYRILGSSKSEKTRNILRVLELESATDSEDRQDVGEAETPAETAEPSSGPKGQGPTAGSQKKAKGHGRNGADDYKGARQRHPRPARSVPSPLSPVHWRPPSPVAATSGNRHG
jgi:hypothetical protein